MAETEAVNLISFLLKFLKDNDLILGRWKIIELSLLISIPKKISTNAWFKNILFHQM